jgi:alkanesulfonate monooxygenase SsuD/methylene tetrahydromethanopterin reductase-like flavin-dependent oxidoreductase (luciferase family)
VEDGCDGVAETGTLPMKVGVVLPIAQEDGMNAVPSYREIRAVAVAAEEGGLDSVWVYDHLLFRFDGETTGIHECWTILAAIAEATSRVQLGTIVMCTSFRNAALLAKMAGTLDHLSDGRLILGIGCGWHDPEYEAFGYPTDHRVGRFEESLTIIRTLIRDGRADLDGRWMTAKDVVLVPPARPDLPILIAAKRPRMLELTARHADAWNIAWFGAPDDRWRGARADLEAACAAVGRDPASLERTVGVNVIYPDLVAASGAAGTHETSDDDDGREAPAAASPNDRVEPALRGDDEIAAGLAAYAEEGTGHLIAALEPTTPEAVARLAATVRAVRSGSRVKSA